MTGYYFKWDGQGGSDSWDLNDKKMSDGRRVWEDHFKERKNASAKALGVDMSFTCYRNIEATLWQACKESACNAGDLSLIPGLGRSPGKRPPTPIFWLGEFRGLYSPWSYKKSDMTEQISLSFGMYWWAGGKAWFFWTSLVTVNILDSIPGQWYFMGEFTFGSNVIWVMWWWI